MRIITLALFLVANGAAFAQLAPQCEQGATLTHELEAALERFTPQHPTVTALAAEIKALKDELRVANPGKSIEDICEVPSVSSNESSANEMICRREQVTGSHRRVRVCRTRGERRATRRQSQAWYQRNKEGAGGSP